MLLIYTFFYYIRECVCVCVLSESRIKKCMGRRRSKLVVNITNYSWQQGAFLMLFNKFLQFQLILLIVILFKFWIKMILFVTSSLFIHKMNRVSDCGFPKTAQLHFLALNLALKKRFWMKKKSQNRGFKKP